MTVPRPRVAERGREGEFRKREREPSGFKTEALCKWGLKFRKSRKASRRAHYAEWLGHEPAWVRARTRAPSCACWATEIHFRLAEHRVISSFGRAAAWLSESEASLALFSERALGLPSRLISLPLLQSRRLVFKGPFA